MRIQLWAAVFAIGGLAVAAGCGSSSDGGGSSSGGGSVDGGGATVTGSGAGGAGTGSTTATGTGSGGSCGTGTSTGAGGTANGQACNDCLSTNCNTEYSNCLGPGWMSGTFSGGACSAFFNCLNACCTDATCFQGCQSSLTAACSTCQAAIGTCFQSKCMVECGTGSTGAGGGAGAGGTGAGGSGTGSGGSTGGSGGGATCADLQTCCNAAQFPVDLKASCDMLAQGGDNPTCAQALAAFKATGSCP